MLRLFVIWVLRYAAHTLSRFGHSWYIPNLELYIKFITQQHWQWHGGELGINLGSVTSSCSFKTLFEIFLRQYIHDQFALKQFDALKSDTSSL